MGDYAIRDSGILDSDVHCESGYRGIQINDFTLDRLISYTWNYNSVHLTKLFCWWDNDNFNKGEVNIDWTVDENISDKWLGVVAWGENVNDI